MENNNMNKNNQNRGQIRNENTTNGKVKNIALAAGAVALATGVFFLGKSIYKKMKSKKEQPAAGDTKE